jgi:hypothetical protein
MNCEESLSAGFWNPPVWGTRVAWWLALEQVRYKSG